MFVSNVVYRTCTFLLLRFPLVIRFPFLIVLYSELRRTSNKAYMHGIVMFDKFKAPEPITQFLVLQFCVRIIQSLVLILILIGKTRGLI
jgi:membrane protein insertase Oxa1/YidC/SpoIIIJ